MDDVRAVMNAAGSESAALFGYSEGGPMSMLFAATYPQRVRALVLYGTYAKRMDPDDDYPWCETWEERQSYAEAVEGEWGVEVDLTRMAPGADEGLARRWMARARASASPAAARALVLMNSQIDVRNVLPSIQAKTLVLHRRDDHDSKLEEGRYVAEHIPGAGFVELPGETHVPGGTGTTSSTRSRNFLPASARPASRTASSRQRCSRTSSIRPVKRRDSATVLGQSC